MSPRTLTKPPEDGGMSTNKENTMSNIETLTVLGDELASLETEIARLRLRREALSYRLEQAVRERDRKRTAGPPHHRRLSVW